ncbi:Iron-containing redox enzyme [Pseudomonas cuatrocienegasensis]|uniref:Iron-containing redox enzyme n=1 Tax=Pseudomonas cuatrocienegasensis TaxID=543360 RepID=A0ABY1B0I5_9PSED|nr:MULTISPECIES: iron-containing redox enzyme family protein [Pseudomonas]OEC36101.1 hypothetical protein A7D25_05755 [Pseudomonas sp. 21C1]SEP63673.1 Iron-containing redox enzyme [Pseudomonas cuatrocienegasensis]
MTTFTAIASESSAATSFTDAQTPPGQARQVYEALLQRPDAAASRDLANALLEQQLAIAADQQDDLPEQPQALAEWINAGVARNVEAYQAYLEGRKTGAPRRYFSGRAQALHFIRSVAPTKCVDGAWLYGLLPHYRDVRFHGLIRTYLEELGDGDPALNHVVLYQKLLARYGCDDPLALSDEHYLQGALQLSLGYTAEQHLPELIGYNLGYEQLPLHLMISAFELNELGIDPYYFQLHVTIDNASTGHAHKAMQAVLQNLPVVGDAEAFYRRVRRGYRLNDQGIGSTEVIKRFDLHSELLGILERKRQAAGQVHSDYCRIEGRTVNEWLSVPGQLDDFLQALEKRGWIQRHRDPQHSRFWQLVQGEQAAMFGVFSPYELQVLHDWIAGGWQAHSQPDLQLVGRSPARAIFRSHFRQPPAATPISVVVNGMSDTGVPPNDFNDECQALQSELDRLPVDLRAQRLIDLMAPAHHATPAGLYATRQFSALLQQP